MGQSIVARLTAGKPPVCHGSKVSNCRPQDRTLRLSKMKSSAQMAKEIAKPSTSSAGPKSEIWTRICKRLRVELGEDVYVSWFARLELDRIIENTAYMSVPTRFLKSWIEAHYADKVLGLFKAEASEVRHVSLSVRTNARVSQTRSFDLSFHNHPGFGEAARSPGIDNSVNTISPEATIVPFILQRPMDKGITAGIPLSGSPLDRRLTFATFLVGKSNLLATRIRFSFHRPNFSPLHGAIPFS